VRNNEHLTTQVKLTGLGPGNTIVLVPITNVLVTYRIAYQLIERQDRENAITYLQRSSFDGGGREEYRSNDLDGKQTHLE